MSASSPVASPLPTRGVAVVAITLLVALAACDTGDGTVLREPTAPTTLPPPDTTLLPAEPIDEGGLVSDPVFETVPASSGSAATPGQQAASLGSLELIAPWEDGGAIDLRYTCDGSNAAPAISWSGVPDGTAELAVSLVDESDVTAGRPFIHWVIAGIDPGVDGLGENEVPPGAVQGINFFGDVGYTGPCPDPGNTDDYTLTLHAVEQQLEVAEETPAAQMLDLVGAVTIDSATSSFSATR